MLVELRQETSCYYSSPRHQNTIWGRFFYIYEGRGLLSANSEGLRLIRGSETLRIPFKNIKSVGLGQFSKYSKPGGLTYLDVKYATEEGDFDEIYLVPFHSMFDPTWTTSQIVLSWLETLRDQEALQGRIEPPTFDPSVDGSKNLKSIIFVLFGVAFLLAMLLLGFFAMGSVQLTEQRPGGVEPPPPRVINLPEPPARKN